jgi:hypothetical protein
MVARKDAQILNEKEERIITFRFDRQGTFLEKLI